LGRVLRVDVQSLGSSVEEEESADDRAEAFHRLQDG
jgi:hypothetical protein